MNTNGQETLIPFEFWEFSLSPRARWLCMFLLSKPPTWRSSLRNISKESRISRISTKKYLQELSDYNVIRIRNSIDGNELDIEFMSIDQWTAPRKQLHRENPSSVVNSAVTKSKQPVVTQPNRLLFRPQNGVYALRYIDGVKIGYSSDLPSRLKSYASPWNKVPEETFQYVTNTKQEAFALEQYLLTNLAHFLIDPTKSKEWFRRDVTVTQINLLISEWKSKHES